MRRRIPEVIQSSAMDCGPAALKALLEGFGIGVSYGRLREACQTDVDGTSIDALEEVASSLGLAAEQVMLPVDHLLLPSARTLPAILVVRLPSGLVHFVVVWRKRLGGVEIMDPVAGRRGLSERALLGQVHVHRHSVSAKAWREWASGEEFLVGLRQRMEQFGAPPTRISELMGEALADPGWFSLAALDAAVRTAATLSKHGPAVLKRRSPELIASFFRRALSEGPAAIPGRFWFAAAPSGAGAKGDQVVLQGAVLVRVQGRRVETPGEAAPGEPTSPSPELRSPELTAALEEDDARPFHCVLELLLIDGWSAPAGLVAAIVLSGAAVVLEALLFRGLLDLGRDLGTSLQRLAGAAVVVSCSTLLLVLEAGIAGGSLQIGRKLEIRLRMLFDRKIPRLEDRYLASRLVSDMAERSHSVHRIRQLPIVGQQLVQSVAQVGFTVAGLAWVGHGVLGLSMVAALVSIAVPVFFYPALRERDLRVRSHGGALSRYYFDALSGLVPILSHGGEQALQTEHEGVLREWLRAGTDFLRVSVVAHGIQLGFGILLAVAMVTEHLGTGGDVGVLLLAYWALRLPTLGQQVAFAARRLPALRSITLRLTEPLGAPEGAEPSPESLEGDAAEGAVALRFEAMTLRSSGHDIVTGVDLSVPGGSHVAVVGPSGAGKSTLMGALLGWHRPALGAVFADGELLDGGALHRLRQQTAWVDSEVQIWNRSLLENLLYGHDGNQGLSLASTLSAAELVEPLERMPKGMETRLGESGASVSGGEGQRVRFGRALQRSRARLVILDEPFRGLDRGTRRRFLERARRIWAGATLFLVSHDLEETLDFPRVLIIEGGRVIEDGPPLELMERAGSRYRMLLEAERRVQREIWDGDRWRHLWIDQGCLDEPGEGDG